MLPRITCTACTTERDTGVGKEIVKVLYLYCIFYNFSELQNVLWPTVSFCNGVIVEVSERLLIGKGRCKGCSMSLHGQVEEDEISYDHGCE